MKDSDFKKRLFNECIENLASKGRSAAETNGTQPTDTQQPQGKTCSTCGRGFLSPQCGSCGHKFNWQFWTPQASPVQ